MEDKNVIDLFCVDCQKWTRQKFQCKMADHTLLYICSICGCENSIEIPKDKESK